MATEEHVSTHPNQGGKLAGDVRWDYEVDEPYLEIRDGVRFTPVREGDVDAWSELHTSPGVSEGAYLRKEPYTREKAQKAVTEALEEQKTPIGRMKAGATGLAEWPLQVIREYPSGKFIGLLGIYPTDSLHPLPPAPFANPGPVGNQSFDIGYMILPQYSSQGITTAAVRAAIQGFAEPVMNLYQLGAEVREGHAASLAILKTNGFEPLYTYSQRTHPASGVAEHRATKYRKVLAGSTVGERIVPKRLEKVWWDGDEPYLMVNGDVRITPVRASDAEAWVKHWNDPLITGGSPGTMTLETAQERTARSAENIKPWFEKLRKGEDALDQCYLSIIRSHPDGALMGYVGWHLSRHPLPPPSTPNEKYPWTDKTHDIWYNMNPAYRGRGSTKAAVITLMEGYMGPVMRLPMVGAGVNADHTVSRAILRGIGMEEEFKYERFRPDVDPIPRLKMVRRLDQASYD